MTTRDAEQNHTHRPDTNWGRWYLRERCDTDPDDPAAARDLYEIARGWFLYRGTRYDKRSYDSLVDAITEIYGQFPVDWPPPYPEHKLSAFLRGVRTFD